MHGCFLFSHFNAVQLFFQVGGIKDKVLAAHRAGMKRVILPKRNEKDLKEVDDNVKVREGGGGRGGHGGEVEGWGWEGSQVVGEEHGCRGRGMKRVILPKRNEKDLKEVDDNVKVREGGGVGKGHREREKGARVVGEGNEGSDSTKTK